MPFLLKRNDIFYVRVKVPSDLSPWFSEKTELRKSLKTKNKREARVALTKHLERTARTFALMRSGLMTGTELKKLADDYLRDTLAKNDRERLESDSRIDRDELTGEVVGSVVPYSQWAEEPFKVLEGKPSPEMERILKSFLVSKGLAEDSTSLEYKKLLREISRVHLEALRIDERRDMGDFSDPYYLAEKKEPLVVPSPVSQPVERPETPASGLLLSKLIDLYSEEKLAKGKWTPKTQHEVTASLTIFVKILGDIDVQTLSRPALVNCLTKIQALKVKGKPVAARTVKKYMVTLSSVLKWAAQNSYVVKNQAEGLTPTVKSSPSEERSVYATADLQKLVTALKGVKEKDITTPERWWIPLISLFSGMRLDEVCQLYKEDVKEIDGVWVFDINNAQDKKMKTDSSIRKVPIHPVLISLGFLKYCQSLKHDRLWPNLKKGRDGYSSLFGKWFQRFNRQYITKDKKKVFHSLRHSFVDNLKQTGVQEQLIAELVGHSTGSITAERYGKRFNPHVLKEAIQKLDYGIDLSQVGLV